MTCSQLSKYLSKAHTAIDSMEYQIKDAICTDVNTVNITDMETGLSLLYTTADKKIALILVSFVLLVGCSANAVFLCAMYRVPHMRTVTNAYLCSVAMIDILFFLYWASVAFWGILTSEFKTTPSYGSTSNCIVVNRVGYLF